MTVNNADFKVKKGLVVADGDVTLASDHSVKAGTFDTNVAAAGVTLTGVTLSADGTDTNIPINITPKGTGSVVMSKVDINGGTGDFDTVNIDGGAIDGTIIGGTSQAAGYFTTLDATNTIEARATGSAIRTAGKLCVNEPDVDSSTIPTRTQAAVYGKTVAGSGTMSDGSTTAGTTVKDYVELLLQTDAPESDIDGYVANYVGNAVVLDNVENVPTTGQGVIFSVGGSGSGDSWGVGRAGSTGGGVFQIGYFAESWQKSHTKTTNSMMRSQSLLDIDTSGNATLNANGAYFAFTGATSGAAAREIRFKASSNGMTASGDETYTLPVGFPSSNKVLQSTDAGVLSWVTGAAGGDANQTLTTGSGISGANSGSDGDFTMAIEAAQTTITSILATDLKIGEDDQTKIDFETADEIHFYAANAEQVYVADGVFGPQTDSDVDLGTTGVRWKNAFVDTLTTTDDVAIGDDLTLLSDNAILGFGEHTDVTLTHIPDTGIRLNTNMALQFRDSALSIGSTANGQLDIQADATVAITAPDVLVSSTATSKPLFTIKNTHDGTTAGELRFVSDDGAAGADGDDIGTISFYADDSGQNQTAFASIVAEVSESADTDEAGKLTFFIAESDGTNTAQTAALILEGEHATDGQVDVTIGAGAASTTTIVGDLVVNGSTTTISTAQLTVEDSLITIAKGNDSLANADGAGIEIECTDGGATNPVFIYNNASTAWRSNVDIDTSGTGNTYKINGTEVLNATTLGSAVVSSSLTSTGALNGGSITSGFGSIDTGSSTITTTGLISGGSLDIDDVLINGSTIGHTDDTDLITLANGVVTVAGEISVTTLDIGGTNVTSTAAELNLVDGITAGTVSAEKAVIVDSDKDVTGFRNVTGTGALQGATLSVDAVAILDTASADSETITGETNLFSIPKGTYKAAKILYHIKKDDNNRTDAGEILVTHDGTNAFLTHYAQVNTDTSAVVGTWDCTVNSANIEVRFTPTANGAHSYCLVATQLIVEP